MAATPGFLDGNPPSEPVFVGHTLIDKSNIADIQK